MLATVGTGDGRDLAREGEVERRFDVVEGGKSFRPAVAVEERWAAGVGFDTPERSSLGIWYCMGNGVWTVTTGVRLSALDTR